MRETIRRAGELFNEQVDALVTDQAKRDNASREQIKTTLRTLEDIYRDQSANQRDAMHLLDQLVLEVDVLSLAAHLSMLLGRKT